MRSTLLALYVCGFLAAGAVPAARGAAPLGSPLPTAKPETVGMSTPRLAAMVERFRAKADQHLAGGFAFMVARDGKLVLAGAVGSRNLERALPMTLDTRFRIASMSKPITTVAVLMLYEEGRFHLDDPVAQFLPEFAHARVFTGVDAHGALTTEPAQREITIRDLLTHTSGLGYLFDAKTPLGKAYLDLKLDPDGTLADEVRQIAGMPLYFQPGTGWFYSYADDVLGRLVEVVSGQPFAQFLQERLFVPLRMDSTGFFVPAEARDAFVTMYRRAEDGSLQPATWPHDAFDAKVVPSGGGGVISTVGDYLRFAQMLANGGNLDGRQYLSPVTVDLMTSNQVPETAMADFWGPDSVGLGFGFGVGVELDTRHAPHAGYPGDVSWGGVFDTHWVMSPRTGIVAVLLSQMDPTVPGAGLLRAATDEDFQDAVFAAVVAPRANWTSSPMTVVH